MFMRSLAACGRGLIAASLMLATFTTVAAAPSRYLSPTAIVATKDGSTLFVACATGQRVLKIDTAEGKVAGSFSVPNPPLGLVLSADESTLFVTCGSPEGQLCLLDAKTGRISSRISVGHTAMAPVLTADGKTLYVCNRFNNDVSVIDLDARKETRRIAVRREPVAADLSRDGRYLLVANLLHDGAADAEIVSAVVSVIDTKAACVKHELPLPNGSGLVNDLRVSPDGRFAAVTHLLARYQLPTTQLDRGWMISNALTLLDVVNMQVFDTVLLDNIDHGAANPWGAAWSPDGRQLVVTHAGTHEVSIIDFPALLAKLNSERQKPTGSGPATSASADSRASADLSFLVGVRQRFKLNPADLGPRSVVIVGQRACVANYFSDTLAVIDLESQPRRQTSIALGPKPDLTEVRRGEFYFHDASICFQEWQSCSSCHPGDARVDGLNWDLLNDGIGNPKNVKSLLLAHRTPPAMSLGVRDTAQTAVRAGLRHSLFTVQPEEVPTAIDAYLKSLKPVPSPLLQAGRLSKSAKLGQTIFQRANCGSCHPPGLFTDLRRYDVGTRAGYDGPTDQFDTPTLVELWRTAPYLHDGSAANLREVFTSKNQNDQHGKTSNLSSAEIDDLCAYLLSL